MRDTLRDEVDLMLISIYAGKDFNPNQPRDPHTGEWIDSPGLPSVQVLDHAGSPTLSGMPEFDTTLMGSSKASLDAPAAKALDETLKRIAEAHQWPEGGDAIPIRPVDAIGNARGSFVERMGKAREIRLSMMLSPDDVPTVASHEMGHFLDVQLGGGQGFASEEWLGTPASSLWRTFLHAARESPTGRRIDEAKVGDHAGMAVQANYLDKPREIFGRAYSQWILKGQSTSVGSWPDSEFGPIAKALEAILRYEELIA